MWRDSPSPEARRSKFVAATGARPSKVPAPRPVGRSGSPWALEGQRELPACCRPEGTKRATSVNVRLPRLQRDLRTGLISRHIVNFPSELCRRRNGMLTDVARSVPPGLGAAGSATFRRAADAASPAPTDRDVGRVEQHVANKHTNKSNQSNKLNDMSSGSGRMCCSRDRRD